LHIPYFFINIIMEEKRIYSTILIKRRVSGEAGPPPMLQHGELAMNEVNNTLYIGTTNSDSLSSSGIIDHGTF